MKDSIRLLKNIAVLAAIGGLFYLVYWYFFTGGDEDELTIDDTGIKIESIRTIAEISTINYSDEVVVDSVERYDNSPSLFDPRDWQAIYSGNVKRRLTLIVRGEVQYGLDLTDGNYKIDQGEDTIIVRLPHPKRLDVVISPSKTEVFQEEGKWKDSERKKLELRAKYQLMKNASELDLEKKAEKHAERLMRKMIKTDKKLIITFE